MGVNMALMKVFFFKVNNKKTSELPELDSVLKEKV